MVVMTCVCSWSHDDDRVVLMHECVHGIISSLVCENEHVHVYVRARGGHGVFVMVIKVTSDMVVFHPCSICTSVCSPKYYFS